MHILTRVHLKLKEALRGRLQRGSSLGLWVFLQDLAAFSGRRGIFALLLVAGGAALEGISLALLIPLLVVVTGSATPAGNIERATVAVFGWFGVQTPLARLVLVLGAYVVLVLIRSVVIYLRDVRVSQLQIGFVEHCRARIVERLAATPWHRLVKLRYARITHVMSGDIQRVGLATDLLLHLSVGIALLMVQCLFVFLLAPMLAVVTLALLALTAFAYVPVTRRAHVFGAKLSEQNQSLLNATTQFLGGLKLAIGANQQGSFVREFRKTLRNLTERQVSFQRQHTKARLALQVLSAVTGGFLVLTGFGFFQVPPATLITLLFVIIRMSGLAGSVQQAGQQFAFALPAYDVIKRLGQDLLDRPLEHDTGHAKVGSTEGPIIFNDVTFTYDAQDDEAAIRRGVSGLNLTIMPGEFVGIVGPSGSGKTTFADLLVGLCYPQKGSVSVSGASLEGETLSAWRERVSYVAQDAFLFHDTVRRNLAWSAPAANEEDMWSALRLVDADTLVRAMQQGLDTVVGERGTLMSGGERQRLALARAMLRNPRLLIIDEATSAIDITSEHNILMRLCALKPRMTIIMIAHRTESLNFCTRVLNFKDGQVADESEFPLLAVMNTT